ncbi:MAG: hypothetical protein ABJA80_09310, partial [bacterium]
MTPWTPAEADVGDVGLFLAGASLVDGDLPRGDLALRLDDAGEHGRQREQRHQLRIEQRAASLEDDVAG